MTDTVSYNWVTDINYIKTAIITPDHKVRDMNSYISQLPKGKRITHVIWTVLYLFLMIGVAFVASFSRVGVPLITSYALYACRQTKHNVYIFTKLWGRPNEVKSWNRDSLDWVHFSWYHSVQKRMKYARCIPTCEASVAISVTNKNDLQLSSKYLLYILEEMSTESVSNIS